MPLRSHDYRHLIERWRTVARKSRVQLRKIAEPDGLPLYALATPALTNRREPTKNEEPGTRDARLPSLKPRGVYISAGIHGDEPASTEGLITWAESLDPDHFASLPLLLLPCLNPWGLVNNRRSDASNIDLNRSFHLEATIPVIKAVKTFVTENGRSPRNGPRPLFAAALMLHEDYDGQGIYLYEAQKLHPYWGEEILKVATRSSGIPIDPRLKIENRKVINGIHRRRLDHRRFAKMGYPEAIWLHMERSARTFTVETPSEFAIEKRVAAHVAMINEVVRRVHRGS